MNRFRKTLDRARVCLCLLLFLAPMHMLADTTLVEQGVASGRQPKTAWTKTLRIKGSKMRVDSNNGSETHVYVYDLEAGKKYRLDEKKKQVFVTDLAKEGERMKGTIMLQSLRKVIKPTGRQLIVSGLACDEYTFDLQAPSPLWHGANMILHDHGTVCVTQVIPAGKDVMDFIHKARKRGYLSVQIDFGPPVSPIGPSFYGEQANALVLSSTAGSEYEGGILLDVGGLDSVDTRMTVTSINTEPLADGVFEIPSEWKMKKEVEPH